MWIVEINFAGRRFTHHVFDRRPFIRFAARSAARRTSQQRDRAA